MFYTDTASTLSVLVVFYVAETQLEIELGGERKLRKERVSEESPDRNDRSGQLYGAYSLRCLMQQSLLLFVSPNPNPITVFLILPLLILDYSRTQSFWKIFNRTDIMCVYNDETDKCSVGVVYRWHYDAHSSWANDTIQVYSIKIFPSLELKKLFFHCYFFDDFFFFFFPFLHCYVMIVPVRDSTIPSLWVIIEFLQNLLNNLPYLLRVTCPMLVPILAFLVFVVINKGIVIGE